MDERMPDEPEESTDAGEKNDVTHGKQKRKNKSGTHQVTMFHNIQALLDMLQRSHNSPILILHLSNLR